MVDIYDFIVVGGGSAGAVIAARLSEDPDCRVALVEAGETPPPHELMPLACAALQLDPSTDWMYTADAGNAGLGLDEGRMMVPRGKMLGGSSGINYMAYVRGHPGDFDAWAADGASGWGYDDVLSYFKKSEGLAPSGDVVIDGDAHNTKGPLGVSVRSPIIAGAQAFVEAAAATGFIIGDYNGRDRMNPDGVVSLMQTSTKDGKRSSTYHAFLEGSAEQRPNLSIITGAQVTRVVLDGDDEALAARGIEFVSADGATSVIEARKEVVLSAGAVGSPQILMLSGIGPTSELESVGVTPRLDLPVGKHLKDHLEVGFTFNAPGAGVSNLNAGIALGPDALREPNGPLPADPSDDEGMDPALQALKAESERQLVEWFTTGRGLASSSMYDASAWYSTGLGDPHTHDAQIAILVGGANMDLIRKNLRVDPHVLMLDPETQLGPFEENISVLANPVQPHSEGEIVLVSSDPLVHPEIRMNYFDDPHDMKVMISVIRKALEIAANWPSSLELGPLNFPPFLAEKHQYTEGSVPSDALLEDYARHYSFTVYHLTSTCRMGDVVDPQLRVMGVANLRVADASVMPNVVSGNTNAASIMIGEKAAELLAAAHNVHISEFVGTPAS
jgi:choline dehydrogenase-like flavoprotein